MRLVDRDSIIMGELDRWRFCLSRQIRALAGFTGQRACDRRLKILIDNGYIDRKHILYGTPSIYTLTHKARAYLGISLKPDKIKIEQIKHDIIVIDTAIFFMSKYDLSLADITTEKQLHQSDGFGLRKHRPDFIFLHDDNKNCVEIELTPKAKDRQIKNIKHNFMEYDNQFWIVPSTQIKIMNILNDSLNTYPNIVIINLEEVTSYVNRYNQVDRTE